MIEKVHSKEYATLAATEKGASWGESELDHCIYVGDIDSLRRAGVKIGVRHKEPLEIIEQLRRYQIILPLAKNDGSSFPPELLDSFITQLTVEFGGLTIEKGGVHGVWRNAGVDFCEENLRLVCDVPATIKNLDFFINFKKQCKVAFEQEEIWLTSFPVDRVL